MEVKLVCWVCGIPLAESYADDVERHECRSHKSLLPKDKLHLRRQYQNRLKLVVEEDDGVNIRRA